MILVDDEFRRIETRLGHSRFHRPGRPCSPLPTSATRPRLLQLFPVVDGVRLAVLGDMGTMEADGTIVLLGRGSMCINSGGEKVYPRRSGAGTQKLTPAVFRRPW